MPRRILRAGPLAVALGALLTVQCKQSEAGGEAVSKGPSTGPSAELTEGSCRGVLRRPHDQELVTLGAAGLLPERLPCFGRSTCFDGNPRIEALPVERGLYRVRAGAIERLHREDASLPTQPGMRIHGAALGMDAALLASQDGLEVIDLLAGRAERFPMPSLGPNEWLRGAQIVDGGIGYRVARRDDPCAPAELRWLRPPETSAVIPAGAHLVHFEGKLLGWLEERAGRSWFVRHPSGARIELPGSFTDVLAVHALDGLWLAVFEREAVVFDDAGRVRHLPIGPDRHLRVLGTRAFLVDEAQGVFRVDLPGEAPVLRFPSDTDLGGGRMAPGARRERVQAGDDGAHRLLLIERLRLPSCRAEDRVHLLDVETGSVRTWATGDRVRMHPTFTPGGFRWVEGTPEYTFVALGDE